jgi:hypothetical protein
VAKCLFWWGFDKSLDNLGHLRERFGFSKKSISAAPSSLVLDVSRSVSSENDNFGGALLISNHLNDIETI